MSFVNKNLLPNEKVLFRTKKHLIIFLYPLIWTIITCLFFLHPNPIVHIAALFPLGLVALFWLNQFLIYYVSEFAITNIRIIMREGFFVRHVNDTRLNTIANVNVNQSLVGQALNYGTVIINSFGGGTDPFKEIAKPIAFQNQLQNQLYHTQQQR